MRIGIAIFAYNRSNHLKRVLEGLKQNERADQIYIFQDGLRQGEDSCEWEKTKTVIKDASWSHAAVTSDQTNKGLAQSVVTGVNRVLEDNDAVIVLEDDCVPHPDFVSFMKQCFEKYKDQKRVYSLSGYAWPGGTERSDDADNYFCGRISSWGWGTWRDRWKEYDQDYTLLKRIKEDSGAANRLALWGNDLEQMLIGNLKGTLNSWAVFWALKVIEKDGLCVNPYASLIQNIGMDGSGEHSAVTNQYDVCLKKTAKQPFVLSETMECNAWLKNHFIFGNPVAQCAGHPDGRKKVLLYGMGKCYQDHKYRIGKAYQIVALVDKRKEGVMDGRPILKPNQIKGFNYDYIFIMIKKLNMAVQIARELMEDYQVEAEKLKLGCILYESDELLKHRILSDGSCEIEIGTKRVNIC